MDPSQLFTKETPPTEEMDNLNIQSTPEGANATGEPKPEEPTGEPKPEETTGEQKPEEPTGEPKPDDGTGEAKPYAPRDVIEDDLENTTEDPHTRNDRLAKDTEIKKDEEKDDEVFVSPGFDEDLIPKKNQKSKFIFSSFSWDSDKMNLPSDILQAL
jgi:hypothetical protein